MRSDFSNKPGQGGKREMSFQMSWTGPKKKKKGRQIILQVILDRQNKDEVFKPADKIIILCWT